MTFGNADDNMFARRPRRQRRGCFSPLCFFITVLVLAGLGVALFFAIPRMPSATTGAVSIVSGPTMSSTPAALQMQALAPITFDSSNYYDFSVKSITINAWANAKRDGVPVATGNKTDFLIAKKAITQIAVPITVNINESNVANMTGASTLITNCLSSNSATLYYTAEVSLVGLAWKIKKDGSMKTSC